ncbi:MAG: Swt1 family HEPN domain-containing protein [Alcanivorax sp.]
MTKSSVREFLFRGLMFESEASRFQRAGIQVGADQRETEQMLFKEVISPFNITRRNSALEMARLYALLFCFENELRFFIRERLEENEGVLWEENLPKKISQKAVSRREEALKNNWLEGEKTDLLGFADFGDLSAIMIEKWEFFKDIIPSQHWLTQRMDELEKARNFIAHNRLLLPSEFQRMYMYVNDWLRVLGV